ncbi:uncharacterized protein MONBRDRAFT_32901 [Monosiga brevicollis MX1]|uniref:Glutaredoxin domain-containing protein n=1 Tax=Monosiga brevicollis TaxID=81824 RepID=A9V2E4_MONBE|nr:uncharacterized protein MONBRDRAFT_32901 [Monosiga brevicollis MX1]EDQ88362.1 predicted protein [Monosiga brevicollis MX1]|eukprot:XP_001746955.1 hypothetical protein [Monosiga brevicollis MX1]
MGQYLSAGSSDNTTNNMSANAIVQSAITNNDLMVFSKSYCPFCTQAKRELSQAGLEYNVIELDQGAVSYDGQEAEGSDVQGIIKSQYKHRTVPAVFVKGKLLGGCDDTVAAIRNGKLKEMLA